MWKGKGERRRRNLRTMASYGNVTNGSEFMQKNDMKSAKSFRRWQ